jgi:hypothetical protein
MLHAIVASLDASFDDFRAECDAAREQHGEWLRETLERTEKQLLNHMCVSTAPLCARPRRLGCLAAARPATPRPRRASQPSFG